ncbi:MAG: diaminopimelate decarboxylase [Proteobacteria bacterium]|nr:diaminopimelate decarboxylase [Pseudomonadota bacterium]
MDSGQSTSLWWERPDLRYEKKHLTFDDSLLEPLARSMGTPLFIYSSRRIRHNLERLHTALGKTGTLFSLFYAMKANRFQPLLTFIKSTGLCGIDACSPEEVFLARACGFQPESISFTATSLSSQDLDLILRHDSLIINCDSISMIRKIGERCPGREIGIRLNPAMGVGYGEVDLLRYSGDRTTKFGIYREQFDEAVDTARAYGLPITRIHFHTGCGYLTSQLETWSRIITTCLDMAKALPQLQTVNLGGGLGLPHTPHDKPLDLEAWASVIHSHFSGTGIRVELEPGDFIVKDSGILLLEVNMVEKKQDRIFVGVNGGFNLAMEPAFYSLPCEPLPCSLSVDKDLAFTSENMTPVTIAGNINEALDIWAENHLLPPMAEGDILALINAGGYASAMSSNHCLRGAFREMILVG